MNADGSGAHPLVPADGPERIVTLAWSPDGTRLAYAHDADGHFHEHILVVNVDGSGTALELTGFHLPGDPRTFDTQPAWSPDSSQIAFFGNLLGEPTGVWIVDADGSNPFFLAAGGEPSWSPDGNRIAFERGLSIWMMKRDGTDQASVTPGVQPSWGPTS